MQKSKIIIDSNKDIFIEERKHEKQLLRNLKNNPIIYNKYLIKQVFDENEIELLKQIKNNRQL